MPQYSSERKKQQQQQQQQQQTFSCQYDFQSTKFTSIHSEMSVDRFGCQAVLINNQKNSNHRQLKRRKEIIVFGGGYPMITDIVESCYVIENDLNFNQHQQQEQWRQSRSRMPIALNGFAAVNLIDNKYNTNNVYFFGGCNSAKLGGAQNGCFKYDVTTDKYKRMPSLKTKRASLACALIKTTLFAIGGTSNGLKSGALDTVEYYDASISNGKWHPLKAKMNKKRYGCCSASRDGVFFVIGGIDENNNYLDTIEVYDRSKECDGFILLDAKMKTPRVGATVVVIGYHIMIIGGFDGNLHLNTIEIFNAKTLEFETTDDNNDISFPTLSIGRSYCDAILVDGNDNVRNDCNDNCSKKIIVIGGYGGGKYLATAESIDIKCIPPTPPKKCEFYEKIIEDDKRNVNFKLTELVPLIQDVHEMKIYYTIVCTCYRLELITELERINYISDALEQTALTVQSSTIIAIYKVILDKACDVDKIITKPKKYELDNKAEENLTENSSYIKELQLAVQHNTRRIDGLEANVKAIHTSLVSMKSAIDALASNVKDINETMSNMKRAIKQERRIKAAVGFVATLLNLFSFGAGGTAVQAIINLGIDHIVDFGDLLELQDFTTKDVLDLGLDIIKEEIAEEKLNSAIMKHPEETLITIMIASAITINNLSTGTSTSAIGASETVIKQKKSNKDLPMSFGVHEQKQHHTTQQPLTETFISPQQEEANAIGKINNPSDLGNSHESKNIDEISSHVQHQPPTTTTTKSLTMIERVEELEILFGTGKAKQPEGGEQPPSKPLLMRIIDIEMMFMGSRGKCSVVDRIEFLEGQKDRVDNLELHTIGVNEGEKRSKNIKSKNFIERLDNIEAVFLGEIQQNYIVDRINFLEEQIGL